MFKRYVCFKRYKNCTKGTLLKEQLFYEKRFIKVIVTLKTFCYI